MSRHKNEDCDIKLHTTGYVISKDGYGMMRTIAGAQNMDDLLKMTNDVLMKLKNQIQ